MNFLTNLPDWVFTLAYIVFTISAVLLIIVVLLQQGRGGGLADFVSGVGSDILGVQAKSKIGQATIIISFVFLGMILLLNFDRSGGGAALPDSEPVKSAEQHPGATPALPVDSAGE